MLQSVSHPKGAPLKRGRPTKGASDKRKAAVADLKAYLNNHQKDLTKFAELHPMREVIVKKRAPSGTFDRKVYQRELMRKRRATKKEGGD